MAAMRLRRIKVAGLFGTFDHDISLNDEQRITIIHGPNGYGKTIILKMINGLLSSSYSILQSVPFTRFEVIFDNGNRIVVEKQRSQATTIGMMSTKGGLRRKPKSIDINGRYFDERGEHHLNLNTADLTRLTASQRREIDRVLPAHLRLSDDGWYDVRKSVPVSFDQILRQYKTVLRTRLPSLMEQLGLDIPTQLWRVEDEIHVHLIGTERLNRDPPPKEMPFLPFPDDDSPKTTVEKYSREIVSQIRTVLAAYAGRASELDRTFPRRLLLNTSMYQPLSLGELKMQFTEIEAQRQVLIDQGFLDQEQGELSGIPEELYATNAPVLTIYVRDTHEKLSTFSEMSQKISLFTKIVNSRFKNKTLQVSRERGFVVDSKLGELALSELSSGEQHELVLLHELLFRVDKSWLVMLDEPEISLHVAWQERFLEDLQEIVKLSNVDVLLATHSPVIIGERWDLTSELKPPHGEG